MRLYDQELRNSCISDEEMRAYVEKYFLFKSILEKETHQIDENGRIYASDPSSGTAYPARESLQDDAIQAKP
jgi:hypothetical protein